MDQEKLDILLLDYSSGRTLSKEDREAIQQWLEESDDHRRYYEEFRRAYTSLCSVS